MFSLFQPMLGIRHDAVDFLDRRVPITLYGEPAWMLDPVDQILDSLFQIHLRVTLFYYIESGKDLLVRNFLDLVHLLLRAPDGYQRELRARIEAYGRTESAFYSLHFARLLYPQFVPAELVDSFQPADTAFLDEYGQFDGGRYAWKRSFAERRSIHTARRR